MIHINILNVILPIVKNEHFTKSQDPFALCKPRIKRGFFMAKYPEITTVKTLPVFSHKHESHQLISE